MRVANSLIFSSILWGFIDDNGSLTSVYIHYYIVPIHRFLLTLAIGQVLALLLSGSGVFSQLLEENYSINTPSTQVFFMYFLLAITFTPYLAAFQDNFDKLLRDHWWKYGLLAILDVEGNYCFVLAYQYTSLTSIQVCVRVCACIVILHECVSISVHT